LNLDARDGALHELVIIRRRAESEGEAHKGGVWKIAYADFMTAMMAFFLVMWLINAANEETRSQVASYFNPVKLVDTRTNTKGLQDLEAGADGKVKHEPVTGQVKSEKEETAPSGEKKAREETLFSDPYSVLTEIAGPVEEPEPTQETKAGSMPEATGRSGRLGGPAFMDPFDPQTWQKQPGRKADFNDSKPAVAAKAEPPIAAPQSFEPQIPLNAKPEPVSAASGKPKDESGKPGGTTSEAAMNAKPEGAAVSNVGESGDKALNASGPAAAEQKKVDERNAEPPAAFRQDANQIEKDIAKAVSGMGPGASPQIDVRGTKEGVLISLADNTGFGMFAIASAEPQAALVHYMDKIAAILKARPGTIIISGHTDGRPFRSDIYDNWRLSSARAQMAYYMLVRGGIDEQRIERIEGHADHDLKVPGDPEAAENRRIEILLRETKS
jgi:chemotaxis protein MotB